MEQMTPAGCMLDWTPEMIGAWTGYMCKRAWPVEGSPSDSNAAMTMDTIPLYHSRELVMNDPYMNTEQKGRVDSVFNHAAPRADGGKVSYGDLAGGAIRAGFGLAGGLAAGLVLGNIFSLPMPVTRALSISGGIYGTLKNTGVI